jgi:hypothetical protein
MSASDYYLGALFLCATYGAVFAAVELVVRRRLPQLSGATRAVAWAMLATAGLIAVHLAPAALTILSRETALLAAALLFGAAWLVPATPTGPPDGPPPKPGGIPERLLATVGLAAAGIWLLAVLAKYLEVEPVGFDAASAYYPTAARWLQEGSIWEIADWVPNAFYGSGPGNGSVIVLSAMLPWENDFLAHLAMYPYVVLMVVALYALAREVGAPSPAAILLALMVTAAPVVVQPGFVDGLLDPVMYTSLAAGILFLIRHDRSGSRADLALAGLALGICFGTKFYGYTSVAVVVCVWVGARLWAREPVAAVARQTLAVGAMILAAGGIWMVRNAIETGNPLMPLKVDPLGITIFDAPPDPQRPVSGDTLASYFDQPRVWVDTLAHQFRVAVGIPLLAIAAALVGAVGLLLYRRRYADGDRSDGVAIAAIVAALIAALAYAFTPYSAPGIDGVPNAAAINVRYGIPAMIVAVVAAGWLAGRIPRPWLIGLCAVALGATFDALRIASVVSLVTRPAAVYVAFAAGVAIAAFAWALERRGGVRVPRPSPTVLAGLAGAALIVAVLAGQRVQRDFNADRYLGVDPAIDYVVQNTGDGTEVGLAGHWALTGVVPTYPSFGPQLENRVDYIGGVVDDALLRSHTQREPFLAALGRSDPDLLILGRDDATIVPEGESPAAPAEVARWAREAGYREVLTSERFVLMERS